MISDYTRNGQDVTRSGNSRIHALPLTKHDFNNSSRRAGRLLPREDPGGRAGSGTAQPSPAGRGPADAHALAPPLAAYFRSFPSASRARKASVRRAPRPWPEPEVGRKPGGGSRRRTRQQPAVSRGGGRAARCSPVGGRASGRAGVPGARSHEAVQPQRPLQSGAEGGAAQSRLRRVVLQLLPEVQVSGTAGGPRVRGPFLRGVILSLADTLRIIQKIALRSAVFTFLSSRNEQGPLRMQIPRLLRQ